MLLSTPQELQQHIPSLAMETIDTMSGYLDNSEHDFLLERIGAPLHAHLEAYYADLYEDGNTDILLAHSQHKPSPIERIIILCQRVITFDAFSRSADIMAVSVNGSGLNVTSTDGYDATSQESIKALKAQCAKEAHAAANRLLVQLEEWAKTVQQVATDDTPVESDEMEEKRSIVKLWKSSKFYYLTEGVLFPTATALGEYLDIYESREKFIQLLPDLRYIQEMILAEEVGEDLLSYLTDKANAGTPSKEEARAINLLRRAAALHLEDRSKLFKRDMAHTEALHATAKACDYIREHLSDFPEKDIATSPLKPKEETSKTEATPLWSNNKKGNVMFVAPRMSQRTK